jgi:hypothetical protein
LVQIPSVLLLYKGDTNAIIKDAGFYNHRGQAMTEPLAMPILSDFVKQLETTHQAEITGLNIFNYGDKNAVFQTVGLYKKSFNESFSVFYQVDTDSYPKDMNLAEDNIFSKGLLMLYAMHFANYAGTDMRLIYFILAIGFCAMIVAGNVLWVLKRQKKNEHPKTLAFTRAITLGACLGVITATALGFLLERSLPESTFEREHVIEYIFLITLLLISLAAFFVEKVQPFIGFNFFLSGIFLLLTVLFEWIFLNSTMSSMLTNGYYILGYVSASLGLAAALLIFLGIKIIKFESQQPKDKSEYSIELQNQNIT